MVDVPTTDFAGYHGRNRPFPFCGRIIEAYYTNPELDTVCVTYREDEQLDLKRFENLGIVKSELNAVEDQLDFFLQKVNEMRDRNQWDKEEIVTLFQSLLPEFNHIETMRSLDQKM